MPYHTFSVETDEDFDNFLPQSGLSVCVTYEYHGDTYTVEYVDDWQAGKEIAILRATSDIATFLLSPSTWFQESETRRTLQAKQHDYDTHAALHRRAGDTLKFHKAHMDDLQAQIEQL